LAIFQGHQTVSHQISCKRCVILQKLLQTTNRKPYSSFWLVHLWWPWRTFEGHFSLVCRLHIQYLRNLYILYKIRPQLLKLFIRNHTRAFKWYVQCDIPWRHFKVI